MREIDIENTYDRSSYRSIRLGSHNSPKYSFALTVCFAEPEIIERTGHVPFFARFQRGSNKLKSTAWYGASSTHPRFSASAEKGGTKLRAVRRAKDGKEGWDQRGSWPTRIPRICRRHRIQNFSKGSNTEFASFVLVTSLLESASDGQKRKSRYRRFEEASRRGVRDRVGWRIIFYRKREMFGNIFESTILRILLEVVARFQRDFSALRTIALLTLTRRRFDPRDPGTTLARVCALTSIRVE